MSKKIVPPLKNLTHTGPTARAGLSLGELIGRPFLPDDEAVAAFLSGTNADEAKAAAAARFERDVSDWRKGQRAGYPDLDKAESLARKIMAEESFGARKASELSAVELAQEGIDVNPGSIEKGSNAPKRAKLLKVNKYN